ncbi:MAG: ribosome assembly factor SBDS [Candidatus Aenigmarchaeota archaeon]|nr:ribosome assembly factor SBDS [Candidatus Aenigmarchaeota archaeon]
MEPVVARFRRGRDTFEILVYPKEAVEFKKGIGELTNVLVSDEIFLDVQKGKKAPDNDLKKAFKTDNKQEIAKTIIKEGEVQLPKAMRDEMLDKKKRQIAAIISKMGVNPQTKAPHPPERILGVMDKLGVNVDPYHSAEDQVQRIVEKIRVEIPISIENVRLEIKVPMAYGRMAYGKIKAIGKIMRESWNPDGSLSCVLEVPAGQKNDVYDKLGGLTHGEAVITESK